MKEVTRYAAEDGTEYRSRKEAEARDKVLKEVEEVMKPLGKSIKDRGVMNDSYYIQHRGETVKKVKLGLLQVAMDSCKYFKEWIEKWLAHHNNGNSSYEDAIREIHISWFSRMSEGSEPIRKAYFRLYCIDEHYREWSQPYYTDHTPDDCKEVME